MQFCNFATLQLCNVTTLQLCNSATLQLCNENTTMEQLEEEKLEKQIRELRKNINKARLHPTKEQGPTMKRRKIGTESYVSIQEIWGTPTISSH